MGLINKLLKCSKCESSIAFPELLLKWAFIVFQTQHRNAEDNNKWNYEASRQDQIPFGSPIGGSLHVSIFEHSRGQALACKFRVDIIFVESAPHRVNLADCRRDGGLDDHKGAAAHHNDGAALTRGLGICHVAS